jgi:hypothetical protein
LVVVRYDRTAAPISSIMARSVELALLLADGEQARYECAARRWHSRFVYEAKNVDIHESVAVPERSRFRLMRSNENGGAGHTLHSSRRGRNVCGGRTRRPSECAGP